MTSTTREKVTLEALDRKTAELAGFLTPSEIFRALLEGTAAGSPRAAIYLLREGRFKGWSSIGYPADAAARQRLLTIPSDHGWLGALAGEDDVRWRTLIAGERPPDFGQGLHADVTGLPVRVGGRAIAIVVAERQADEEPWFPAAISILCQAARLRLELDLAWRRLKSMQEADAPAPAPAASPSPALAATPTLPAAPAPTVATAMTTEIAPWTAATETHADPRREEARRYARLVATDIRLYNEEAVVLGRREGDLAARLGEQLTRGREAFNRRFPELGTAGAKLLEEAFVQVLAGGDGSLLR